MNPFETIPVGDHGVEVTRLGMGGVFIAGRGPADGQYRVLRGGSWLNAPGRCRSAARSSGWARQRFYKIGFRVILE